MSSEEEPVNGTYVDIKGRMATWPPSTGITSVRTAVWEMCERLAPMDRH